MVSPSPLRSNITRVTSLSKHEYSKHVFVPNFCNMDCGYIEITPENKHLVESCYEARTEKELPVLVQYIDRNKLPPPKATHLDIILYSWEQIIKENEAVGNEVSVVWIRLVGIKSISLHKLSSTFRTKFFRFLTPTRLGASSA